MEQDNLFPLPPQESKEIPRDPIWDALDEEFGEVRTKSERGRRNQAVRELRDAEVTPEEIKIAVDFCRRNFTNFTEMAVCGWLGRSLHEERSKGTANVRSIFERMRPKETQDG